MTNSNSLVTSNFQNSIWIEIREWIICAFLATVLMSVVTWINYDAVNADMTNRESERAKRREEKKMKRNQKGKDPSKSISFDPKGGGTGSSGGRVLAGFFAAALVALKSHTPRNVHECLII